MEEAERQRPMSQATDRLPETQSSIPNNKNEIPVEESMEARLERLGRQRPEIFPSLLAEIGFIFSVCMSQVFGVCSSSSPTA
jgi:hypothetical protein